MKADNARADDLFGTAIALSASGSTLAVGAQFEDSSTAGIGTTPNQAASRAGAVYVFGRRQNAWEQHAYVKASNPGANDHFGRSVALSADGTTLLAGAPGEDSSGAGLDPTPDQASNAAGAAYLFQRGASGWAQAAFVKATRPGEGDSFGTSAALSDQGDALATGAPSEASSSTGVNSTPDDDSPGAGAAYVFHAE